MTLGWIVEGVTGEPLDAYLARRVFGPLGMADTGYRPDPSDRARTAPTEQNSAWRPYPLVGEVHDENAHALGGVAGHAGLFASAQDLAVFAGLFLAPGLVRPCDYSPGSGAPCGAESPPREIRLLQEATRDRFTRRAVPEVSRALGWDTPSGRSSAGDFFSAPSFGHTGFTGTSIWIDPELDLFVVLLTNRVNPTRENERHIPFRRAVHDGVATAVLDRVVERRQPD
jgi:CubicO group peptidase (beta-lactamase class C family)